ncbi:MAG: hypothetical protein COW03_09015 [Cytophagales bacterium CG12_big_fil_rev_8_21_14_0_65_40_12]|nr:MAG: hypothetical protein COW03_09015 [Cytophagales bacterium CG12_big_fil_rev_8_21_14_0_65_40_12]PIW05944.1 MAG: hypothetical protein COW40_01855 [Cytophagales bacterium CG17_big_fil_post_rev_8_21_14_2_50_40_13]
MSRLDINWNKLKSILKSNSWFLWVVPLFIIVSFTNGLETGLIVSGLMISGIALGTIIPVTIGAVFKKYDLKSINGALIIFMISTALLLFYVPDKKLLALMIPFSIPLIIIGMLNLRK